MVHSWLKRDEEEKKRLRKETIRPHVPLIKFRKGGLSASDMLILIFVGCLNCEVATHASDPRGGTTASVPSSGGGQASQKRAGSVVRTVKEHELPWRLQRKDIDEAEMAYINGHEHMEREGVGESEHHYLRAIFGARSLITINNLPTASVVKSSSLQIQRFWIQSLARLKMFRDTLGLERGSNSRLARTYKELNEERSSSSSLEN
uniref:Uncharacterized protein n=1 Tax=Timema tahoe TaxID=61484 RepID=A0A7R9IL18_9NEOP|nr:unnamed protein product [Timema tahoe]